MSTKLNTTSNAVELTQAELDSITGGRRTHSISSTDHGHHRTHSISTTDHGKPRRTHSIGSK
jgi:hypothetical protein